VICPVRSNSSNLPTKNYVWQREMKRKWPLILVALFVLILLSCDRKDKDKSFSPQIAGDTPAYGDMIIEGSLGDTKRLIPMLASDSASGRISGLIFNGLVKYDKDINIIGDLAKRWDISEDGLTITFHLRKGVRWHDGVEFTAEDVLFTYQKLIDEKVATPYSGDFLLVEKAELLDKYTFRVIYKESFAPALISWGMGIIPKHLLEYEDLNTTSFNRAPVGTGPYTFEEWNPGERIVLRAFKDYFEGCPYIERLIYRIIPDEATMFLSLKAGDIDFMGLSPIQYSLQTETPYFKNNFQRYRYPSFAFTYLGFNLLDDRFKDKRIREAFAYAIDKENIIKGILLGLGEVATGPYPPTSWAYNPEVKRYSYNPDKAKKLLKICGWYDSNGDGYLDKNGQVFKFTLITNQGNIQRKKCAEMIQHDLSKIGIKVEIRILEWQTFLHEFVDKKRFEALILGWSLSRDPDLYDIFHSSKIREGEFNFVSYKNPEVDRLLIRGRRTFDQEERQKIYQSIHLKISEDLPYLFLYVPDSLPIIHRRFRGIKAAPLGIGYNFTKWYVPEKEQKYKIEIVP